MRYSIILLLLILIGCSTEPSKQPVVTEKDQLFVPLSPEQTHVSFVNKLTPSEEFNMYTYRNFYNGAGVGIGDLNNDGLADLYFCGNQVDNKLYFNKGNFEFEEVTDKAGVACKNVWTTGVSLADINGDGWLDIYVCKSGLPGGDNRHNELFINQQDGTFKEAAHDWGIADKGLSTHAAFFDFDKDGDLDCYLLNNSFRSVGGYDLREGQRAIRDEGGGNKFYRNDGQKFTDISEDAGIYGSAIGFGLGVTIGDVDKDGWQDIFVSNDFFERDYLYLNQQDGTFKEELTERMPEISMGSMGADMADLNNDGFPEIFVTEMLPRSNARYKTKATFESWDKAQRNIEMGYHYQFGRNALHLNNQNGTFSEISRLANIAATDWSWGALIADFDLDGLKDVFVANGIYQDLLDQDYINFYSNDPEIVASLKNREAGSILKLISKIPSVKLNNHFFINKGDFTFEDLATTTGMHQESFSNGSAYGDLDNDGDLDLVVSNIDDAPFILKNTASEKNNYINIRVKENSKNTFGIGTKATVYIGNKKYYQELCPMRGYQSCVDYVLNIGLGNKTNIDSLEIIWNDQSIQKMYAVEVNQTLQILKEEGLPTLVDDQKKQTPVFNKRDMTVNFKHQENIFSDFNRDRLLMQMYSSEGPKIAKGDVNKDGLDDFYIGNAKDSPGALFIQTKNGSFKTNYFEEEVISEDTGCAFFDADNDGDLDLYVASGGSEFPSSSSALKDRLYVNDGKGNFSKSKTPPHRQYAVTSCVRPCDFDKDGDVDLFIGNRQRPFLYGVPVTSLLLENNNGTYKNILPQKENNPLSGMITDGQWADFTGDGQMDLLVVGDWMSPTLLTQKEGKWIAQSVGSSGLWNCVEVGDVDGDGDMDFVVGNLGLNSRLRAAKNQPLQLHINDFDRNGSAEQILTMHEGANTYPLVLKDDLIKQLPALKKQFLFYESYKEAQINDLFPSDVLERTVVLSANQLATCIFLNNGDGTFEEKILPYQAQIAPTYAVIIKDFNKDDKIDILIAGNLDEVKPEIGAYRSSYGLLLLGNGKGDFLPTSADVSGINISGAVRDLETLTIGGKNYVVVVRNDDEAIFLEFMK